MKQLYNAALYIRLSREDGDGAESNSVQNQRSLLKEFANGDAHIVSTTEFVDDGYTGTDFLRPSFQKMMDKINNGTINCVVVKDLSRLGRNYIELGRLTEIVFPQKQVRFISINDGIDTLRPQSDATSIIVPFKNLLNDEYSRDISSKIRTALDVRRKSGAFIGSFPSYGYKRDENDSGKLVIDEEAAQVVRRIFDMYLSGMGKHTIARTLNAEGVLSPSAYKKKMYPAYRSPNKNGTSLWSFSSVDRILNNEIYVGDMVQGKTKMISHRIHTPQKKERDDWIVVQNTHEPIIARERFVAAKQSDDKSFRADKTGNAHVLAGLVRCGSCGRSLNRRSIKQSYGTYNYYFCPTYRQSKTACTKHSVRVESVEQTVLSAIRNELNRAADLSTLYETYKDRQIAPQNNSRTSLTKEIDRLKNLKRAVYEDWKGDVLTKEEYLDYVKVYSDRLDALSKRLQALPTQPESINPWLLRLSSLKNPTELSRELVLALVERIEVFSDTHIRIHFTFADALKEAETELKQYVI